MDLWLGRGTFFFLLVFVAAAPDSIAVTQIAYSGALLCWVLRWWVCGRTPRAHPLALPLLFFLILSGVSASQSFAPIPSWAHMKSVALLLICVLWAENTKSVRQLKLYSTLLIAASLITVIFTAWQYSIGIGVRLSKTLSPAEVSPISPETAMASLGLENGDCISSLDGHWIRDPAKLADAIEALPTETLIPLTILRGQPLQRIRRESERSQLVGLLKELRNGKVRPSRGRPLRAQGFYDHYVTYADVLVQIGLLVWGLFAVCPQQRMKLKTLLGLVVVALACALWLTLTRAAMASFLAGCLLVVFIASRWRIRWAVVGLVIVAVVAGGFLLRQGRGLTWVDLQSPEAQYRLLMWKDGLRLIREHPLWGVGMDSIMVRWREWNIEAYEIFPLHSHFHSTPLQIAVERGLLTLLAWLWLLAEYIRVLFRLSKATIGEHWYSRGLKLGLLGAAFGFLLGSLVDYNWGDSEVIMVFWMFVGWAVALDSLLPAASCSSEATHVPPHVAAGAGE